MNPAHGLLIQRAHYQAMREHVMREAPYEACGLLGGQGRVSRAVYAIPNALQSPHRFRMEPRAQVQAMFAMEQQNLTLLAIYHSHPHGPGHPSPTDFREAAYPDPFYLIWAPVGTTWVCRAFRWTPEGFDEVPLHLA